MPIQIVPYTADHVAAVREFNRRLIPDDAPLAPGADDLQFPETPDPGWLPGMELFVACEGDAVRDGCIRGGYVRGGYMLRRQEFSVLGETVPVAHYRLPLSEGIVDRKYAMLGLRLVRDALAREPRLYALGMGGAQHPLPQMLQRLGWRMCAVPFHFKVVHPFRFLREIRALRTTPARRFVLDAAAYTGAGWLGLRLMGHGRRVRDIKCETAATFSAWADAIWDRSRADYAMLAARNSTILDALYPPDDPRFLRIRAAGGWAVLLDTAMEDHKQFGSIRVGTIVDCLAPPADAATVVRAATRTLEKRGVDLIVSNQLHDGWRQALTGAGFRRGPSNFLFAASPALAALLEEAEDGEIHINRGDGDGPIHL
jgi:hypothetical protein